jgi:hypothetical protein
LDFQGRTPGHFVAVHDGERFAGVEDFKGADNDVLNGCAHAGNTGFGAPTAMGRSFEVG